MRENEGTINPQQLRVNPADLDDIKCADCGNITFTVVNVLKKVPALLSPSSKEQILAIPVHACNSCGNVNDEFLRGIPFKTPELKSPTTQTAPTPPPFGLIK